MGGKTAIAGGLVAGLLTGAVVVGAVVLLTPPPAPAEVPVPSPVAVGDVVVLSAGYPTKVAMAIRAGGSGDVTGTDRVLWRLDKGTAYVAGTVLVVQGAI